MFRFLRFRREEQKSLHPSDLIRDLLISRVASSGQTVDWTTLVQCSTALACARVLSEGIAQLPFYVRQRDSSGITSQIVNDHPLSRMFRRGPNTWMTWFEFVETLTFNAVLGSGGFALVVRSADGRLLELLPIPCTHVKVRKRRNWEVVYEIQFPATDDGTYSERIVVSRPNIMHLRGPSMDGVHALEGIRFAREAVGLSLAAENAHARLHNNAIAPSGIYSVEGNLSKEQYERLSSFLESHFARENRYRPLILDRSAKWQQISMTGVDAQHLETRRFQVEEVCRFFRVFPLMVGHADKAMTYASAEQMFLAHVVHSLMPWVRRWESVLARDLLTELEQERGIYVDVSVQGLLRGDARTRSDYFSKAIQVGWMTRNEVRVLEELPPLEGLDEPLFPMNLVPQDQSDSADQGVLQEAE